MRGASYAVRAVGLGFACCVAALSTVAAASETVQYTYDARGRLVEVQRTQPGGTIKTKYEYDRADNRTKKEVTTIP
jgi:YD repeat-containing protein